MKVQTILTLIWRPCQCVHFSVPMEKSVFPWLLRFTHVLEIGVCSIHLHVVSNGFMTVDILLLGEWKRVLGGGPYMPGFSSQSLAHLAYKGLIDGKDTLDLIALLCG